MSTRQLVQALQADTDPYLGTIPADLCKTLGKSQGETQALLDRLSERLRGRIQQTFGDRMSYLNAVQFRTGDEIAGQYPRLGAYRFIAGNKEVIDFQLLGAGVHSMVYKMSVGGKDYAFKVFTDPDLALYKASGPFKEAANGLYMTARQTSNLPEFIAANPSQDWHLLECIGPHASLKDRPGKTYQQQGFAFDDEKPANTINDIRVDYGEMMREDTRQMSDDPDEQPNFGDFAQRLF